MLKIEFLKIVKRKFNYIYFLALTVLSLLLVYRNQVFIDFLEINQEEYIFNYLLKILLILFIFFQMLNLIISYREDYTNKVNQIIKFSKLSHFRNLLSKVVVNAVFFIIFYLLSVATILVYANFIQIIKFSNVLSHNYLYYFILVCLMMIFVANLSLVMVSIFNNYNLSIALSLLFFMGSKFLVNYLEKSYKGFYYLQYTFFDIFNIALGGLGYNINHDKIIVVLVALAINSILLFIFSLLLKSIKHN